VLEFVAVEVGLGRPMSCERCAGVDVASYRPASEIASAISRVAEGWSTGPGPNVLLTGPEPFAHPELPALVAACVSVGVQRVALETDGAALSAFGNAAGVLRAGVRHLRVRLNATEHGVDGPPDRTADALAGAALYLAAAAEAGVTVAVTAVLEVCAHTVASLSALVVQLAPLGFSAVRLESAGSLPPSATVLIAAACDTGMVNGLWVEVDPALPLPPSHVLHAVESPVRASQADTEVSGGETLG